MNNDVIDGRMSQAHINAEKVHTAAKDKIQKRLTEIADAVEEYRQLIHATYGTAAVMDGYAELQSRMLDVRGLFMDFGFSTPTHGSFPLHVNMKDGAYDARSDRQLGAVKKPTNWK